MKLEFHLAAFSFPKREALLENIDISLHQGEILAVLGANGIGKTTLVKGMLGLIPFFRCQTLLNGLNIKQLSAQQRWQKIGYVPQARDHMSSLPVEDMILLGRSTSLGMLQQPRECDLEAVHTQMAQLGIAHLRGQSCATLSGGQLQMALLARALCNNPALLVLDEPESNLDYKNQTIILKLIKELSQNKQIGSLFITHYPQHALQIADKVLLLFPDKTHAYGSAQQVMTKENLLRAYGVHLHIENVEIEGIVYPTIIVKN